MHMDGIWKKSNALQNSIFVFKKKCFSFLLIIMIIVCVNLFIIIWN